MTERFRLHQISRRLLVSGSTMLMKVLGYQFCVFTVNQLGGYLYRQVIPRLAEQHRVIVPDHMGFGKSETPQDREYTLKAHVDNLEALVLELDLHDITWVLHDWGGPIGTGLALRHPERIARLIATNTCITLGLPIEADLLSKNATHAEYFQWMAKLYEEGTMEAVLGNVGTIILSVMKSLQGFERMSNVNQTWLSAYSAPFTTPSECIGAINFPLSIVSRTGGELDTSDEQAVAEIRRKPATMMMGMKDRVLLPQYFIPLFQATFPDSAVYKLENAGHFCYEDEPEAIAALIKQFINLT